jgi:hypothetical protein
MILLKTDERGIQQWYRDFGGTSIEMGYSAQQTSDGGYIVAGYTMSYGSGVSDVYMVKTDTLGNQLWYRTFGGSSGDGAYSIRQTCDSGYIIAGFTCSYGNGNSDVYLIKTDSEGNQLWYRTFGGFYSEEGYCVQQTLDCGYVVVGYTCSYGAGSNDVYLIKTDSTGNQQWYRTFGGTHYDYGWSVQQTNDSGYIIVGFTGSFGGGRNVYVIKTDSTGIQEWSQTYGGNNYDEGYCVKQTNDGGYIIVGQTFSYGAGSSDVYLIRLECELNRLSINPCSDVQQTANLRQFSLFSAYPNPFNNKTSIKFELTEACKTSLIVYDIKGHEVRRLVDDWRGAGIYEVEFDGEGLSSGVYLIALDAGKMRETRKIVLIK